VKRTDAPNFNEPFIGDYIGIAASPTMVHVIWTDDRSACDTVDPTYGCVDQDAFTATISVNPLPTTGSAPALGGSRGYPD
jgi:hypothetical protein